MKCPNCGADTSDKFCPYCGSEMPYNGPDTVINDNRTIINNYYGSRPDGTRYSGRTYVSGKKKSTALILCVLFGVFGIHLFYVGKIGKGILYFCTCGLFCIGWIIDIAKIASGSFTDSKGLLLDTTPMSQKEKGGWFLGLLIFGIFGIISCISGKSLEGIAMYLVWITVFGVLYYRNGKKNGN